MDLDADFRRRLALAVVVGVLLVLVGYALLSFVAVLVFAVFLYYAVRPIFRFLERLPLGRRLRAALSIGLFGLPFLVLTAYAVAIIALQLRAFLDGDLADQIVAELNIGQFDLDELETLVTGDQAQLEPDVVLDTLLGAVSFAGSVFVQLLLIVAGAYYMLVDGPRLVNWFVDTYDESGTLREYVEETDPELSVALFGNIVNVFAAAILSIVVFFAFNLFVPETIAIPFPALLGALAGIGSLIPVVGIKLVFVPLTVGLGARAWLAGEPDLLLPVAVLFVVSAIVLDFIPDMIIRAQVSSDDTHTGLLLVAYIIGPSVFGFYGLFLAPILLICTTNAMTVLLPYVVSGETRAGTQTSLDTFGDDADGTGSDTGDG